MIIAIAVRTILPIGRYRQRSLRMARRVAGTCASKIPRSLGSAADPCHAITMKVVAIDHVQLAMPTGGEAAARRFYGEVLGFTEVPKPEAMRARGGVWFQAGPVQVHLGVEPEMKPSLKAHPALVVTELDRYRARLAEAGCRWQDAAAEELPDVRRGHTWDPFGNRIELIEAHGRYVEP
jgi:catechol 2,3-dioxygenase-like lactoylglutathione lyase family enzyme